MNGKDKYIFDSGNFDFRVIVELNFHIIPVKSNEAYRVKVKGNICSCQQIRRNKSEEVLRAEQNYCNKSDLRRVGICNNR